ncbi:hypothetical protein Tco_0414474 [Tanacetum coccineum]
MAPDVCTGGVVCVFRRRGAQQTQIDELAALMQPVTLSPISDRWTWTLNSSGEFSVASVRNLIDVKMFPEGDHKTRWIRYVPIKVNTHAWKVMTNSLPTRFNISRRVARLITRWWDVPDLEMDSYGSWKIWMVNLRMPSKDKKMLVGVFYVMWWLLWAFRNKKIFEDKAPSKAMFFDDVICVFRMLSARAALHVSVLTLSFNLSCGPPIWGTDGPRSSDEWADVATEACGDSDRGCGTGKHFQGNGGSGCTDDVEFSVPKPGGPNEDGGLDGLIGEVEERMPLMANGRICRPEVSVVGGGLICVVLAGLRGAPFAVVVLLLLLLVLVVALNDQKLEKLEKQLAELRGLCPLPSLGCSLAPRDARKGKFCYVMENSNSL